MPKIKQNRDLRGGAPGHGRTCVRKRTPCPPRVPKLTVARMNELPAILIVDDDGDVRQAARLALAAHARVVEMAASPSEMAACLAPGRFDCVLLDMNFAA